MPVGFYVVKSEGDLHPDASELRTMVRTERGKKDSSLIVIRKDTILM